MRQYCRHLIFILAIFDFVPSLAFANEYFYDIDGQYSIKSINQAEFKSLNQVINNGFDNGIYWLKIDANAKNRVIKINNNHIQQATAYNDGKVVEPISSYGFLAYKINKSNQPFYIKINADQEAYIPIEFHSSDEFIKNEKVQGVIIGLFYGFALMVIIVNLFYYVNFRDKSFLYYTLFIIVIGLSLGHKDGLINILGITKLFSQYSETFAHTLAGVFGAILACNYLQIKEHYPKLITFFILLVLSAFVFDVMFWITDNYLYSTISDICIYLVFISGWIASLFLFKTYSYAVYFSIAYSLMVLMSFAYFLAPAFGLSNLGVSDNVFKLSSYFEMLIFTYAVVSRMRVLQEENDQMQDEIKQYTEQIKSLSEELSRNQKGEKSHFNQFGLSGRENEVLKFVTLNKSNKEIAKLLFISVNTVKYHIKNIYQKLQIKSRKEVNSVLNPQ